MAPESTPTADVVVDSVDQNVGNDYHNASVARSGGSSSPTAARSPAG